MVMAPSFCNAEQFSFNNNLFLGVDSTDVKVLQKLLNQSADTVIATEGFGSKNNETTYFGIKTRDAVIKFQNKYKDKILTPNGLSVGTGYVGPSTRTVLNELSQKPQATVAAPAVPAMDIVKTLDLKKAVQLNEIVGNITSQTSELNQFLNSSAKNISPSMAPYFATSTIKDFNTKYATTDTNTDAKNYGAMYGWLNSASTSEFLKNFNLTPDYFMGNNWQKYPHIFSVTPTEVAPGDKVTVSGINLEDPALKLMLGKESVTFTKIGISTFTFVVPSTATYGTFPISMTKDGNKYEVNQISILVKKKNVLPSYITSVKAENGTTTPSITDTFIIKGDNFDTQNEISTSFGIISNVQQSSKNEIKFSLADAPLLSGIVSSIRSASDTGFSSGPQSVVPTVLYIKNSFGRSNTYGPINIKF